MKFCTAYILFFLFFFYSVLSSAGDTIPVGKGIELLSKLIRFRSFPGHEKPAGEFLLETCRQIGFSTRIFSESDSTFNFSASLYPLQNGKPNILFICHLDVVPANDSADWRHPPFCGTIIHDTLWGRGALDMKGEGIMQLMAMNSFLSISKQNDLPYNVSILFVSGEESGGKNGAGIITENFLHELNVVLVLGEGGGGLKNVLPSNPGKTLFFISVAEKKSLWLKLSVQQPGYGHASVPTDGSANSVLIKAINRLEDKKPIIIFDKTTERLFYELGKHNGGFKGFLLRHINALWLRPFRRFILQKEPMLLNEVTSTCQLTNFMNLPAPPNVIPGKASVYFDCRLVPGVPVKKFIRRLKLRIHNPKVKIEIIDQSPDAETSTRDNKFDALSNALKKVYPGSEVLPFLFPATTDNGFFRAKGINAYGVLPVELTTNLIESIHGLNECIPVVALSKGTETYRIFLEELMKIKK